MQHKNWNSMRMHWKRLLDICELGDASTYLHLANSIVFIFGSCFDALDKVPEDLFIGKKKMLK